MMVRILVADKGFVGMFYLLNALLQEAYWPARLVFFLGTHTDLPRLPIFDYRVLIAKLGGLAAAMTLA